MNRKNLTLGKNVFAWQLFIIVLKLCGFEQDIYNSNGDDWKISVSRLRRLDAILSGSKGDMSAAQEKIVKEVQRQRE